MSGMKGIVGGHNGMNLEIGTIILSCTGDLEAQNDKVICPRFPLPTVHNCLWGWKMLGGWKAGVMSNSTIKGILILLRFILNTMVEKC
jgi:hypothetical protein